MTDITPNSLRNRQAILAISVLFLVILSICIAVVLTKTLVLIKPNQRGMVISAIEPGGFRPGILNPGYHLLIPGVERAVVFDIGRQTYTINGSDSLQAKTADGQIIQVDLAITYAVDPEQVLNLYRTWNMNYEVGLVRPVGCGSCRRSHLYLLSRSTTGGTNKQLDGTPANEGCFAVSF